MTAMELRFNDIGYAAHRQVEAMPVERSVTGIATTAWFSSVLFKYDFTSFEFWILITVEFESFPRR